MARRLSLSRSIRRTICFRPSETGPFLGRATKRRRHPRQSRLGEPERDLPYGPCGWSGIAGTAGSGQGWGSRFPSVKPTNIPPIGPLPALVQELVRLPGGSIAAGSAVGEGTTFIVTVPLGSAHLPADQIGPGIDSTAGTGSSP